ncbi:MAG TPA: 3-deoxy-D-manno-octulosonate 8-phosphate phosphatase [Desulfobulbaceae bacterium]|nr:3-deoxy-D-manno-octulosonate 8-phosphate phosphatase [Desulfobulbaceae bacterium]
MAEHDPCAAGMGDGGYPSDCELTQGLLARSRDAGRPVPRSEEWLKVLPRAAQVRLLLLDVDGVLTDGTIIYTPGGGESKGFNTQDGFGLRMLQECGLEVGLITARQSEAVTRRAADLHLKYVYQGAGRKNEVYESLLRQTGLRPPQTAYMGDDWLDLPLLARVGLAAAPANAVVEVRQRVHYVTASSGGSGAVREVCELILEARGELAALLRKYS